jgi:hypothetical protein
MTRAGIIGAVVIFLLALGGSFVSGLLVPCCAVLVGLGVGYLASMWDKPADNNRAVRLGAIAGAIAGIGAVIGQTVGGVANAALLGPEAASQIVEGLGLDTGGAAADPTIFYASTAFVSCCIGLFNTALMAGLGALGGILWWQTTGKNQVGGGTAYSG